MSDSQQPSAPRSQYALAAELRDAIRRIADERIAAKRHVGDPGAGGGSPGALDAHLSDTVDAHNASAISFVPTGSIAATDVQAAIEEAVAEAGGGGVTNLSYTAATSTVASDTGTDAVLTAVDGSNPGLMTVALKTKLDGIEALADVTDAGNVAAAGAHMAGGTVVPVADGGTGSSTPSGARTNLGLVIDTDVTAKSTFDAHLSDIGDAHDASAISYAGGTGIAATDVEGALDELATEKVTSVDATDIVEISAAAYTALGGGRPATRLYLVTS